MIKLNLGCGQIRPENWINTDSSFNSFIQQLPFGKLIAKYMGAASYQSDNAKYMNLNKRWKKILSNSVDVVYASHLFEHLSLKGAKLFMKEASRVLKPGGAIRLVVPDLFANAKDYVEEIARGNKEAAGQFMWALNLHKEGQYPVGSIWHDMIGWLQGWPHQHKFMYDKYSLAAIYRQHGFSDIKEASFGKSHYIDEIEQVEFNVELGYDKSLYLEAKKI